MAQKQYVKYKDPLVSFIQNLGFLGPIMPGRYVGLNQLVATGTWAFQLGTVSGSGIPVKDFNNTTLPPWAMWVTRQGNYIQENAAVQATVSGTLGDFVIIPNTTGPYSRYDAIIGTHNYVPGTGAQTDATYFIIPGDSTHTTAQGPLLFAPILTDATRQVVLGLIEVPFNAASIADCNIIVLPVPSPGVIGETHTDNYKLGNQNIIRGTELKTLNSSIVTDYWINPATGTTENGLIQLTPFGNTFRINPTPSSFTVDALGFSTSQLYQRIPGTKIRLLIQSQNFAIKNDNLNSGNDPTGVFSGTGFSGIIIPPQFANIINGGWSNLSSDGSIIAINTMLDLELREDTKWHLTNIQYSDDFHNPLPGAFAADPGSINWPSFYAPDIDGQPFSSGVNVVPLQLQDNPAQFNNTIYNASGWSVYDVGNVGLILEKKGILTNRLSVGIGLDFTGSTWGTVIDPTYVGPATISLYLKLVSLTLGTILYKLDSFGAYDLLPAFRQGGGSQKTFQVNLHGYKTIYCNVGDTVIPYVEINVLDTTVHYVWDIHHGQKGIHNWEGEFLGMDGITNPF